MSTIGEPVSPGAGRPLRVTAHLRGPVCMPEGHVALDALLAWAVYQVGGAPPPVTGGAVDEVEIPIVREPMGRFHMCSFSVGQVDARERQWTNRRFPLAEAQALAGPKLRRVQIDLGRQKTVRRPREVVHLVDDRLDWWCVGDADRIRALLGIVGHVGARRGVGLGTVGRWDVVEVTPWDEGFPVLLDGQPLRPLPLDWPGLPDDIYARRAVLTFPYWHDAARRAEHCACPEPML